MKSKEEFKKVAVALSDDIVTIHCTYDNKFEKEKYKFLATKDFVETLQKGDVVIAASNKYNADYQIVYFHHADDYCDINIENSINYCWANQLVDIQEFVMLEKLQEDIANKLFDNQKKHLQNQMRENLGISNIDTKFLIEENDVTE